MNRIQYSLLNTNYFKHQGVNHLDAFINIEFMRKIILILLLFNLFNYKVVKATNGNPIINLWYSWQSDSTYKIKMMVIFQCNGFVWATGSSGVCVHDTCNYTNNINVPLYSMSTLPDGRPNGSEVLNSICPSAVTLCDSPLSANSLYGYKQFYYEGTFTTPERCGLWIIKRQAINVANYRDSNITNLTHSNYFAYGECMLNNLDTNYKNNSSRFTAPIFQYSCGNTPNYYELGCLDQDNDSLVINSVQSISNGYFLCTVNPMTPIPYTPPFTINEPFYTGGTYNFNPSNGGSISFNAPAPQMPLLSFKTEEYRNGIWVGSCRSDLILDIVQCNAAVPSMTIDSQNLAHVTQLPNGEFKSCFGNTINLCAWFTSSDSLAKLKIESNLSSVIPAASLISNGIGTDSVQSCIQWTPSINDTGTYKIRFIVTDTVCNSPGVLSPQYFYIILHIQKTVDTSVSINVQTCYPYNWAGQTYTNAGVYTNTFANTLGCDSIVELNLSVNTINKSLSNAGFSIWSNQPSGTYQWINCDTKLPIAGATNQGYTTTVGGNYAVIINYMGCIDTSDCIKTISLNTSQVTQTNNLFINPNPANSVIEVTFSDRNQNFEGSIEVFDMVGQKVRRIDLNHNEQKVIIDVHDWIVGQYVLKFIYEGHVIENHKLSILR